MKGWEAKAHTMAFRALKPPPATLTGKINKKWEIIYSPIEVLKEQRAIWAHWWQEGADTPELDFGKVPLGKLLDIGCCRLVQNLHLLQRWHASQTFQALVHWSPAVLG